MKQENLFENINQLMDFITNSNNFSRYSKTDPDKKVNCRQILSQYNNECIINAMKAYLEMNDIQYNGSIDSLIDRYVEALSKTTVIENNTIKR